MSPAQLQRGVALITALLVMAIATTLAVTMSVRQNDAILRTATLQLGDQGRELALGGVAFARMVLEQDDRTVDGPADSWAQTLPPMPVDGGTIRGRIIDMQGRFNLNNLVNNDGKVNPIAYARFARLLANLNLNPAILDEVVDWIDPDRDVSPRGAEDEAYTGLNPPYRTANRPMVSVSELRQMRSVDEAAYRTLAPLVAALPSGTAINLNSASQEIIDALSEHSVPQREVDHDADPLPQNFGSIEEALSYHGLTPTDIDTEGLSVNSQYFLIEIEVLLGSISSHLYALVYRPSDGPTQVITRTFEPCLNAISCI